MPPHPSPPRVSEGPTIRGLLVIGLAGLLVAAGSIAGVVVTRLVGGEAESRVVAELEQRAAALAQATEAVCRDMLVCVPQLSRLLRTDPQAGPAAAVLLDDRMNVLAGTAESTSRDPLLGDVLQGAPRAAARVLRPASHPRGEGEDHRVAVAVRLGDGRRAVLDLAFELDSLHFAVAARQRAVLLFIIADLLVILLFGTYLGGRYVVRPLEALTRSAAAGTPAVVQGGPAEVSRLAATFAALVGRLQAQNAELQATVAALSAARDDLVRSERLATVGRLAAGLAHEIGNPLAAVLGYVEYLRGGPTLPEEPPPELRAQLLARMDKELGRIRDILRDLLDFSRPTPPVPEVFSLVPLVESARSLLKFQKNFKDIQVEVTGAAPPVCADRGRIRQVLVNLLLNAADAMQGRGRVEVHLATVGDFVQVRVRDEGPGVPADRAALLFEPFHTTKAAGQGTGLGLAISRRIVEEAGGHIGLESPGEAGACFVFTLPSAQQQGHDGVGKAPDQVVAEEQRLQRPHREEGPEGHHQP